MPVRLYRKPAGRVLILLCGGLLGMGAAFLVARMLQLSIGHNELRHYSSRLIAASEQLHDETSTALRRISHDRLPFCSDAELTLMREFVYNATNVREIGRVREGKLFCTTNRGRLSVPVAVPKPDLSAPLHVWIRAPLVLSGQSVGFMAESGGVSVLLNPNRLNGLNESPLYFSALYFDRVSGHLWQSFGQPMPLKDVEVKSGRYIERDGVFYLPVCPAKGSACLIAAATRADMLRRNRPLVIGMVIAGLLIGASLAELFILIHQRSSTLERQLRRALRRGRLGLVYQPVVELETEKIVGVEALVRWTSETNEAVQPEVFVALAEEKGFVSEITRAVLRRSIHEIGDLLQSNRITLSVNIAADDLHSPFFQDDLEALLHEADLPAQAIGLELTERSAADKSRAIEAISRLRRSGHRIYVDDFGTGYSSLSYLHELDIDVIKIDRTFTRTVGTGAATASVLPQILEMARALGLSVVVEGIETVEQEHYLRTTGRGLMGQGYLFSAPLSAAELRRVLFALDGAGKEIVAA